MALPSGGTAVPGAAEVGGTGAPKGTAVVTEVGAEDVVVVVAIIFFVFVIIP